ncbi:MAG: type IV secretory system conjugative DNA transfer family protein [Patescibacteria group bacterium]
MTNQNNITYIGETDFRNKKIKFGIRAKDRTRHLYIIGKTGMGKSTLLENMAVQDIQNGEGVAFIDPHGGTAEKLLDYIPEERMKDVVYFAPFDMEYPISFNVMEDVGADKRHLVANGLMNAFKKIWVDLWSARMEYILNNVLLALLEYPNATILGVNRMLSDKDYRNLVVANISDSSVKAFWVDEFAKYGDKYMQEAGAAIQNKIGQFISNPLVRNIIGQPKSSFDVRKIMDEKKILIMNLSKGRMGIENSALLGNMLVTKIYLGAMSRADATPEELHKLPNFYFYVDEFQSFANESFADILSEARKYKLSLTIAHQYINQMPDEVRDAVFGNVGSMLTFRIGPEDAELFEKEFAPEFLAEDFVNLGFAQVYLRLMIDSIGSKPFSATTLPPISMPESSSKDKIIEETRKTHSTPRAEVEAAINAWYAPVPSSKPPREKTKNDVAGASPRGTHSAVAQKEEPSYRPPRTEYVAKQEKKENIVVPLDAGTRGSKGKIEDTVTPVVAAAPPPSVTTTAVPPRPVAPPPRPSVVPEKRFKPEMRPAISSSRPLKSQGEAVARQETPASPMPVSLSRLKPQVNNAPSKNNMALKEALAAALKEKRSTPPEPKKEVSAINVQKNIPNVSENGLKQEEKKWEELKKNNEVTNAPKEVPEDVLRKILNE